MALFVGASGVYGQQRPPHPLSNLPPAGSLTTAYYLPDHPTKQFPAGDVIKVVVSAHNDGSSPYNVSMVMGSLNSPVDFSMHIQNFTQQFYFEMVKPGEELSVEYGFRPDAMLPAPREFAVALHLFYEDNKGNVFSNAFFNQTIEIVEKPKLFDHEMLFMGLTLAAIAAVLGYVAYLSFADKVGLGTKSKKKSSTTTKGAPAALDHDDWVKGTQYDINKRKRTASTGSKKTLAIDKASE